MRWIYDVPFQDLEPNETEAIQKITTKFCSDYQDEPLLTSTLQKTQPAWLLRFYYTSNLSIPTAVKKIRKHLIYQNTYHSYSYEPYSIYQT